MESVKDRLKNYAELVHNLALQDYDNTIYCIEIDDAEKVCKEYATEVIADKDSRIEKLEEYNAYLIKAIKSESILNGVTLGVREKFESEIAELEKQLK